MRLEQEETVSSDKDVVGNKESQVVFPMKLILIN